jgi:hypothetical protein
MNEVIDPAMKLLTCIALVTIVLLTGCRSGQEAKSNVVVEKRQKISVADLPQQFLAALDTSSERNLNDKLGSLS